MLLEAPQKFASTWQAWNCQSNNQKMREAMFKYKILEAIGVGILTLFFAVLLNKAYEKLGLTCLLYALAIVLLLVLGTVAIVAAFLRSRDDQAFDEHLRIIKRLIEPRRFPWLISEGEIKVIEGCAIGKEIWVVSPDLMNDTGKAEIIPTLLKNAARGIVYSYVVPDTPLIRTRINELKEVFAKYPDKLRGAILPQNDFRLLSHTHLVIYNPRGEKTQPGRVLLELPINDRDWWVEMSRNDAAEFIGRAADILDSTSEHVHKFSQQVVKGVLGDNTKNNNDLLFNGLK